MLKPLSDLSPFNQSTSEILRFLYVFIRFRDVHLGDRTIYIIRRRRFLTLFVWNLTERSTASEFTVRETEVLDVRDQFRVLTLIFVQRECWEHLHQNINADIKKWGRNSVHQWVFIFLHAVPVIIILAEKSSNPSIQNS